MRPFAGRRLGRLAFLRDEPLDVAPQMALQALGNIVDSGIHRSRGGPGPDEPPLQVDLRLGLRSLGNAGIAHLGQDHASAEYRSFDELLERCDLLACLLAGVLADLASTCDFDVDHVFASVIYRCRGPRRLCGAEPHYIGPSPG